MATDRSRRPRGDSGLGDLAEVLLELNLRDERLLRLAAASLGFGGLQSDPHGHRPSAADARVRHGSHRRASRDMPRRHAAPAPPVVTPQPAGEVLAARLAARAIDTEATRPDWLSQPPAPEPDATRLRRRSLLPRNRAAGVIKAAVATRRLGRRLDVPRLIDHIISRRPIDRLPCLPVAVLEAGADLLCDYGESMQPFHADLHDLAGRFVGLLGEPRCRVFEYETNPAEAVRWSSDERPLSWSARRGRPVVLASDFGCGGSPANGPRLRPSDWRRFVAIAKRTGTPLLAFTPLPPAGLPRWLGRDLIVVHWDPRTRAGTVSRLIGTGLDPRG